MKNVLYCVFLLGFSLLSLSSSPSNRIGGGMLSVVVNGITTSRGTVRVVIFNSQDKFLERDGYVFKQIIELIVRSQ